MENFDIQKILKIAEKLGPDYSNTLIRSLSEIASRELITDKNCDFKDIPWEDDDFSRRILPLATRSRETTIAEADFIERVCDIKPGMNLLDIASGNGRLSIEFAKRGYNVTGIDKGIAPIDFSKKTAKLQNVKNVEFIYGNAADIQLPQKHNCAIIIFGALANFTHDEALKLIEKLAASLVSPGYLVIELCCLTDNVTCDYQEWYFSDTGLWGDSAYFVLMESFFNVQDSFMAIRHWIIDLASGVLRMVTGREQYYDLDSIESLLILGGFKLEKTFGNWDDSKAYSFPAENMIVIAKKC